jgi:hypothetical protein
MHVTNLWKLPFRGTIGVVDVAVDVVPVERFATCGEPPPDPHPAASIGTAATAKKRVLIATDCGGEL